MSDIAPLIETLEHRLMRAWMRRDAKELKGLVDRQCIVQFAGAKRVVLDRLSWVEAVKGDFRCHGYQMGEVYVRQHGPVAILTARFDLEMDVRREVWKGAFWVTDVWKKSRLRRGYRLVERSLSRPEEETAVTAKIRSLQLWR